MSVPVTSVTLDGTSVNPYVIADLTISYGRTGVTEQPSPSSLSMTMRPGAIAPKTPAVGMTVVVTSTVGMTGYTRFTGRITTVAAGKYSLQVTATSSALGRLARTAGPDYSCAETLLGAGANINALLTAAGVLTGTGALTLVYSAGDTTLIPSYQVPAGSLLAQCQALASYDTSGVFFESPAGTLVFESGTDRTFPNGSSADFYLNVAVSGGGASPITIDWNAVTSVDDLVNDVTVNYGSPPTSLRIADETSIASWGSFAQSIDFPVTDPNDAGRKASRLVANASQPRTVVNPINVELGSLSSGVQASMLTATVGTSVGWLPGPSASGITGLPEAVYIEGWTERIVGVGPENGRHTMSLTVSDVALTRTMQTWAEVPALRTWAAVGGTVTWYQVAGTPLT
jgi:hypothetical protein